MRYTIMRWPLWLRGVLIGLFYVGIMVVTSAVVRGYEGRAAVAGGLAGGIIFVTVMTVTMARAERALDPSDGPPLTAAERVQAVRAVDRGQPVDTLRVEVAAVILARQRVRQRIGIVLVAVLFGFLTLVATVFAVVESPRWWLLAAIAVVTGTFLVARLRHQCRGATRLLAAVDHCAATR